MTGYQTGNGVTTSVGFDPLGRVTSMNSVCGASTGPGCPQGATAYSYSITPRGGQVTSFGDSVIGASATPHYDELNRLTAVEYSVFSASPATNGTHVQWTYDRYGNRQGQTITAGATGFQPITLADPATNRITSGGVQYDAAGNMTSDGINSYQYDDEGRLAFNATTGSLYNYDGFGRVAAIFDTNGNGQTFVYGLHNRRVAVINSSDQTTAYQIYSGDQPIAFATGNQLTYQYQNQVGSEGARLKNGTKTTFSSLPFGDGQAASDAGLDEDTYHFAGLDTLPDSSATMHATFRDFHPVAGRWLSPDPYDGSYNANDPQSMNRYVYAGNNPLGVADPSGLWGFCVTSSSWEIGIQNDDSDGNFTGTTTVNISNNDGYCEDFPQDDLSISYYVDGPSPGVGGGGLSPHNLTPSQCAAMKTVLAREAKYGTRLASLSSAVLFRGTNAALAPFNSANFGNANIGGTQFDTEWFAVMSATQPAYNPVGTGALYFAAKLGWSSVRWVVGEPIANCIPFADPGEKAAVTAAAFGLGYKDIFTQAVMAQCR